MPAVLDVDAVSDARTYNQGASTACYSVLATTNAGGIVTGTTLASGPRGAKPAVLRQGGDYVITGLPQFLRLRFAMVHSTGAGGKASLPTGNGAAGTVTWTSASVASGLIGITVLVDL